MMNTLFTQKHGYCSTNVSNKMGFGNILHEVFKNESFNEIVTTDPSGIERIYDIRKH